MDDDPLAGLDDVDRALDRPERLRDRTGRGVGAGWGDVEDASYRGGAADADEAVSGAAPRTAAPRTPAATATERTGAQDGLVSVRTDDRLRTVEGPFE